MVKKARNKKRRAGRIGKTKLQNRNYRFYKPTKISDDVIRKNWDPKKSPSVNLANLGLRSDPMPKAVEAKESSNPEDSTKSCKAIELYDIPDSDKLPKSKLSLRMLPVSIENQEYMIKLFRKYGDDYGKMARDIKINNMQHTPKQLKKIGSRFLLLEESQIRVEIPDNVKPLMSCFK